MHVLKRWATLPQNIRWLAGSAAVVLVLAVMWALLVPIADLLARHDVGSVRGPLFETAVDNARGRLLTLAAGLFAAGALSVTALNFALSRRTFELTEQGQVTDRYTKAVEQLGSDKLDVRIGGIYALERIARDSARDHPTVMEVLTAFIREHSHEQWPLPDAEGRERPRRTRPDVLAVATSVHSNDPLPPPVPPGREDKGWTRPDVQAAITVVGRRNQESDVPRTSIDLVGANLTGANLGGAHFDGAVLFGADLSGARLYLAELSHADLSGADLTGANLLGAKLGMADLTGANLTWAKLPGANLTGADLTGANLTGAGLGSANLTGANLNGANLNDANLYGATLDDAELNGAELDGAGWPLYAEVPDGWTRHAGSGWLYKAGTGAETAEGN